MRATVQGDCSSHTMPLILQVVYITSLYSNTWDPSVEILLHSISLPLSPWDSGEHYRKCAVEFRFCETPGCRQGHGKATNSVTFSVMTILSFKSWLASTLFSLYFNTHHWSGGKWNNKCKYFIWILGRWLGSSRLIKKSRSKWHYKHIDSQLLTGSPDVFPSWGAVHQEVRINLFQNKPFWNKMKTMSHELWGSFLPLLYPMHKDILPSIFHSLDSSILSTYFWVSVTLLRYWKYSWEYIAVGSALTDLHTLRKAIIARHNGY